MCNIYSIQPFLAENTHQRNIKWNRQARTNVRISSYSVADVPSQWHEHIEQYRFVGPQDLRRMDYLACREARAVTQNKTIRCLVPGTRRISFVARFLGWKTLNSNGRSNVIIVKSGEGRTTWSYSWTHCSSAAKISYVSNIFKLDEITGIRDLDKTCRRLFAFRMIALIPNASPKRQTSSITVIRKSRLFQ